jgi:pyruvate/2-oxoglutarate/acetoin dehydrogenase E1 component
VATYGIGAAVVSAVAESVDAKFAVRTVGARPFPIPSSRQLEDSVLPSIDAVGHALRQLLRLL